MSEDDAWRALWRGITPGERVYLVERFYFRVYCGSLVTISLMCLAAAMVSFTRSLSAGLETSAIALMIGTGAAWFRRRQAVLSYRCLRRHNTIPCLAGPVLALASLAPAADANALYFPAVVVLGVVVSVAQRRRHIAAAIVSLGTGALVAALLNGAAARGANAYAAPTVGVVFVGALFAVLVDMLARVVLAAQERPRRHGSGLSETEQHRLRQLLHNAVERARVRQDGFTPREVELFLLLVEGFTQAEAANWLGIAPSTAYRTTARCRGRIDGTNHDVIARLRMLGYIERPATRLG